MTLPEFRAMPIQGAFEYLCAQQPAQLWDICRRHNIEPPVFPAVSSRARLALAIVQALHPNSADIRHPFVRFTVMGVMACFYTLLGAAVFVSVWLSGFDFRQGNPVAALKMLLCTLAVLWVLERLLEPAPRQLAVPVQRDEVSA